MKLEITELDDEEFDWWNKKESKMSEPNRKYQPITPQKRYKIVMKPWQTLKDIQQFVGCNRAKAEELLSQMHDILKKQGYSPIMGETSKSCFLRFFNVDIKKLQREAMEA